MDHATPPPRRQGGRLWRADVRQPRQPEVYCSSTHAAQVDGIRPDYVSDVEGFLDNWMNRYDSDTVHYTPQLLAWTNTSVRIPFQVSCL